MMKNKTKANLVPVFFPDKNVLKAFCRSLDIEVKFTSLIDLWKSKEGDHTKQRHGNRSGYVVLLPEASLQNIPACAVICEKLGDDKLEGIRNKKTQHEPGKYYCISTAKKRDKFIRSRFESNVIVMEPFEHDEHGLTAMEQDLKRLGLRVQFIVLDWSKSVQDHPDSKENKMKKRKPSTLILAFRENE